MHFKIGGLTLVNWFMIFGLTIVLLFLSNYDFILENPENFYKLTRQKVIGGELHQGGIYNLYLILLPLPFAFLFSYHALSFYKNFKKEEILHRLIQMSITLFLVFNILSVLTFQCFP